MKKILLTAALVFSTYACTAPIQAMTTADAEKELLITSVLLCNNEKLTAELFVNAFYNDSFSADAVMEIAKSQGVQASVIAEKALKFSKGYSSADSKMFVDTIFVNCLKDIK